MNEPRFSPIAIIGFSCRFPGNVSTAKDLWDLLSKGIDPLTEIPAERWQGELLDYQPGATFRGGFISDIDQFDAGFFDISPNEAQAMDPQHRLLLDVSHEAFENAGIRVADLIGTNTGVYIGISNSEYLEVGKDLGEPVGPFSMLGTTFSTAAGRISWAFGLEGPSIALDSACSSSLVAIHQAACSLNANHCDLALTGAVNLMLKPDSYISYSALNMISPTGKCGSFSADADGYVPSEGCAALVLKRLEDAQRDNDPILAVLKGGYINNSGRSENPQAAAPQAQVDVIRQALRVSQLDFHAIDYLETHGSGSPIGDFQESDALNAVFAGRTNPLLIGSVKTNLGNMEAAAGMASLIKVILCMQHRQLVPNLHYSAPSHRIDWQATPLQIVTELTPWPESNHPRTAGISARGINGTNAHLILQEWPEVAERASSSDTQAHQPPLFTATAKSVTGLANTLDALADSVPACQTRLAAWCRATNLQRSAYSVRFGCLVTDAVTLRQQLRSYSKRLRQGSVEIPASRLPRVIFMYSAMPDVCGPAMKDFYQHEDSYRKAFDDCLVHISLLQNTTFQSLTNSAANTADTLLRIALSLSHQYSLFRLLQQRGVRLDGFNVEHLTQSMSWSPDIASDALQKLVSDLMRLLSLPGPGQVAKNLSFDNMSDTDGRSPLIALVSSGDNQSEAMERSSTQMKRMRLPGQREDLLTLWVSLFMAGADINWQRFHGDRRPMMSLPVTGMARSRVWFNHSTARAGVEARADNVFTLPYQPLGDLSTWSIATFSLSPDIDTSRASVLFAALAFCYPHHTTHGRQLWWFKHEPASRTLTLGVDPVTGDENTLILLVRTFSALYRGESLPVPATSSSAFVVLPAPVLPVTASSAECEAPWVDLQTDPQVINQIFSLCRDYHCPIGHFLLGCFNVFLYKLTRQNDFSLVLNGCLPTDLVLPMHQALVQNVHFSSDTPFIQWVTGSMLDPAQQTIAPLSLEDAHPAINVQFIQRGSLADLSDLLTLTDFVSSSPAATLALDVTITKQTLTCRLRFSPEKICPQRVNLWGEWLTAIISQAATNPEMHAGHLDLLTEQQRNRIWKEARATTREYPLHQGLYSLLEHTSSRTAIICEDRRLTYRALQYEVDKLANLMLAQGIKPGQAVGMMLSRTSYLIISLLAAIKIGAPYVPLDPTYPPSRLSAMIEASQIDILFSDAELQEGIDYTGRVINPATAISVGQDNNSPRILPSFDSRTLAYIIFTSGSTGTPKGVMVEQRNVVNFIYAMRESLPLPDYPVTLGLTSTSFDIFVLELFVTLAAEGTLVLANERQQTQPYEIARLIRDNRVSLAQMTPSRLQLLAASELALDDIFSTVSLLLVGGEAFPAPLLESVQQIASLRIFNMYGPTETTVYSAVKELTHSRLITLGKPVANTRMYVLDSDLSPLPPTVRGDLYIAGEGLTRGYLNDEQRTLQAYINHPFIEGERLYRTGDVAAWTLQGELEYFGRNDTQIKLRGYRIELQEIENTLLIHPAITGVAVVLRTLPDGQPVIAAFYTSARLVPAAQLKNWLACQLPAYMLPGVWIQLERFPLTPSSKIDRQRLPDDIQPWLSDLPAESSISMSGDEPPLMLELKSIWRAILGDIALTSESNFFDVGGTSIGMVVMHKEVRARCLLDVDISVFFARPTLGEIYRYLAGSR
ncbi:hybrid non-ribosomal peptide synthetase/type I polyketide synthase [Klebsiella quasipneumoniae]|uniref:hybrid non-ribosomal peptide synthetase/type I polyketide synthase n=1 Tax=Klebsiella quasipneumoniae TaxID=1463165 RepID=UPI000945DC2F|nr:amino acid adenylation domain-containing protein [Klebsiella quasipneumoniae]